jgi:hypothetical protein
MNKKAAPPEQVLESALGWMIKALDLQRAILCLRDDARPLLVPRMAQGHKGVVLSSHFEIPVEPPADLFGLLCAKQADVLISDTADPLIVSGRLTAPLRRVPAADQRSVGARRQGSKASKSSTVLALGNSTSSTLRYR